MDQGFLSAKRLAARIRRGDIGCLEALDHAIARVERLDGALNAIVVHDFDRARKRARTLDRKKPEKPGPLYGVPATIKESFDIEGLPTTWGIPALRDHRADSNSLAVERLQAAGAVKSWRAFVPPPGYA